MIPKRIQRKRSAGWRMPPNTIYVGRPGKFGNPYKEGQWNVWDIKDQSGNSLKDRLIERNGENVYKSKADIIEAFAQKVKTSGAFQRIIKHYLKGKNLCCWCKEGEPCHADVLLEIANS